MRVDLTCTGTVDSDDDMPELEEAENVQPPQDANNAAGAAAPATTETEVGYLMVETGFKHRMSCCCYRWLA